VLPPSLRNGLGPLGFLFFFNFSYIAFLRKINRFNHTSQTDLYQVSRDYACSRKAARLLILIIIIARIVHEKIDVESSNLSKVRKNQIN